MNDLVATLANIVVAGYVVGIAYTVLVPSYKKAQYFAKAGRMMRDVRFQAWLGITRIKSRLTVWWHIASGQTSRALKRLAERQASDGGTSIATT